MIGKGLDQEPQEQQGGIQPEKPATEIKYTEEARVERGHPSRNDLFHVIDALTHSDDIDQPEIQAAISHLNKCNFCRDGLVAEIYAEGLDEGETLAQLKKLDWWNQFQAEQEREDQDE